jgi:hypothetical protein
MKSLVLVTPRAARAQPVSSALLHAHEEYLNRRLASGGADWPCSFVTGEGRSVVNAESHEPLAALLRQAPLSRFHARQIFPLRDGGMTIAIPLELLRQQGRARIALSAAPAAPLSSATSPPGAKPPCRCRTERRPLVPSRITSGHREEAEPMTPYGVDRKAGKISGLTERRAAASGGWRRGRRRYPQASTASYA